MDTPKFDFFATLKQLRSGETRLDDLPDMAVDRLTEMMKLTREQLQARYDSSAEREAASPKPGDKAPAFELERLDATGARTGDMRALTDHLDKPVALVFGSYT